MNLLKTLYEIHRPSGKEKAMKKFIKGYVKKHIPGVTIKNDHVGNLYMIKGNAETYPCIVAHLDQVCLIPFEDPLNEFLDLFLCNGNTAACNDGLDVAPQDFLCFRGIDVGDEILL